MSVRSEGGWKLHEMWGKLDKIKTGIERNPNNVIHFEVNYYNLYIILRASSTLEANKIRQIEVC